MLRFLSFTAKRKFVFLLFLTNVAFTQSLHKIAKLDAQLKEISGMTFLNDTVLIAHNDSGNDPILYFLDMNGGVIHQTRISNAKNVDWEDITTDRKGTIFIGDIGNNANKRKNLKIYCVKSDSILQKTSLEAKIIEIKYADQEEFPPALTEMHYDAEGLGFYNDSLIIFTKSQSKPFDGITTCYKLPARPGTYTLKISQQIQLKSRKHAFDAVTAVEILDNTCYLLTYSGIEIFSLETASDGKVSFLHQKRISFLKLSQKEALTVNRTYMYIADEHNKTLGGKNLYKMKIE